jgi:predicted metal-binding membrane protein
MTEHKVVSREEWVAGPARGARVAEGHPERPQLEAVAALAALAVLAAAAWVVTADRMEGMDAGPATDLGGLGWFAGIWATMMAAMMLPSTASAVLAYVRSGSGAGGMAFTAGYLSAWAIAGLGAYALVDGVRSLEPGFLAWDEAGRYLAGGVILIGAIYQLTPPKQACLRRCREPTVVRERWRAGRIGALRMGIEHGGLCIGCCWALMAALFALGVMSVAWMAVIAAMIAAERLLPWRAIATAGVALVLAVIAIAVMAAPEDVPGFTVPGSGGHAMMEMESGGGKGSMGGGSMPGMD